MQSIECNFNEMHNSHLPQQSQNMQLPQQQQSYLPSHLPHPHTMPTPTSAPWNLDSMPWKLASTNNQDGDVMQFSANGKTGDWDTRRVQLHQKRKGEFVVSLPTKQFISEEKITAHFNGLHISSDYIQHTDGGEATSMTGVDGTDVATTSGKCFTNLTYHDYQVTAKELERKLINANRITVCDEVKKFHEEQRKASFIPEALLTRLEKPCTALVLWQPPPLTELLHRKPTEELSSMNNMDNMEELENSTDPDTEIDDFIDNNNTCSMDFNNLKADGMDEDL